MSRKRPAWLARCCRLNACHADFDNDGYLDILMLRGAWEMPRRISLLRNVGGVFEDVTLAAGLGEPIASQAAGWADYDNDGYVDLYIAGEFDAQKPDRRNLGRLYHNRRDGTFEDVSAAAGVTNGRFGKGVAWGDYDDDGLPDLYVSNLGGGNRLYHNQGDGTFVDVAPVLRVTQPENAFACWFWDYDNDGRLDLWVNPNQATLSEVISDQLDRATTGETPRLYRNAGRSEPFQDVTAEAGVDRVVLPMGSNFGDLDNDGYLDIYLGTGRPSYLYLMPNVFLRNDRGRRFEDVTAATGTGHLQKGHGVAFADWDRDGDADLFLEAGGAAPGDRAHNVLFQNPGHGNHWLTIKLVGTRTNHAALVREGSIRPGRDRRPGRVAIPDDLSRVQFRRQPPGLHGRPGPVRRHPDGRNLVAHEWDASVVSQLADRRVDQDHRGPGCVRENRRRADHDAVRSSRKQGCRLCGPGCVVTLHDCRVLGLCLFVLVSRARSCSSQS